MTANGCEVSGAALLKPDLTRSPAGYDAKLGWPHRDNRTDCLQPEQTGDDAEAVYFPNLEDCFRKSIRAARSPAGSNPVSG